MSIFRDSIIFYYFAAIQIFQVAAMSLSTSCHLEEAYEEEKNEGNHTEASAAEKIPPVQALLREQTQHQYFHRKTHYFYKEGKLEIV